MQSDVIFFYNPNSGRFNQKQIDLWVQEFQDCGVNITPVSDPYALQQIRNSHIIAAGGDGTLHVAINAADIESNSFSIFPVGSGNDFASHFKTGSIQSISENIKSSKTMATDLLEVNGIRVHNVCGTGFEALVAQKAHESKMRFAALKYIIPVARHLFSYKPIRAKVKTQEGELFEGQMFMISMGNGTRAGGGFRLFPKASLHDGKLDLLIIEPPTFLQKLMYVWLVNFGKHLQLNVVKYLQTEACTIELTEPGIMQADGDIYLCSQMSTRILKNALKLIV